MRRRRALVVFGVAIAVLGLLALSICKGGSAVENVCPASATKGWHSLQSFGLFSAREAHEDTADGPEGLHRHCTGHKMDANRDDASRVHVYGEFAARGADSRCVDDAADDCHGKDGPGDSGITRTDVEARYSGPMLVNGPHSLEEDDEAGACGHLEALGSSSPATWVCFQGVPDRLCDYHGKG